MMSYLITSERLIASSFIVYHMIQIIDLLTRAHRAYHNHFLRVIFLYKKGSFIVNLIYDRR